MKLSSDKKKLIGLGILILGTFLFFSLRKSESQRILESKLKNYEYDFTKLEPLRNNLESNRDSLIQYGYLHLYNGEKIKFWFLSHHLVDDIGGTIYEFPNGERVFCSGMHCCEVQFYEYGNGPLDELKNSQNFRKYIKEHNGLRP